MLAPIASVYNALTYGMGFLEADVAAGWAPPAHVVATHVEVGIRTLLTC